MKKALELVALLSTLGTSIPLHAATLPIWGGDLGSRPQRGLIQGTPTFLRKKRQLRKPEKWKGLKSCLFQQPAGYRLLLLVASLLMLPLQPAIAAGSEFIEDMPELSQDPGRAGAMGWTKAGVNRAAYKKVMIAPITIFISPDSKYKGLDADHLKAMADGFRDVTTQKMAPEISVVDQGAPGVMYMRAAITNVKVEKAKRGLLGYTPIGFVVKAAKDAIVGPSISLKDAVIEIEMLDALSGERLGILIDKAPEAAGETLSWDSINNTFAYYAERFKARMQAAE